MKKQYSQNIVLYQMSRINQDQELVNKLMAANYDKRSSQIQRLTKEH